MMNLYGPAKYPSASCHAVYVKGLIAPICRFQNQIQGKVRFKVIDPLVKSGYRVAHGDVSYIEKKSTGVKFRIYERGGVYVIPTWIRYFQRQPCL